jgi:hypothetical protein
MEKKEKRKRTFVICIISQCLELITHPRSPTVCKMIIKLTKSEARAQWGCRATEKETYTKQPGPRLALLLHTACWFKISARRPVILTGIIFVSSTPEAKYCGTILKLAMITSYHICYNSAYPKIRPHITYATEEVS